MLDGGLCWLRRALVRLIESERSCLRAAQPPLSEKRAMVGGVNGPWLREEQGRVSDVTGACAKQERGQCTIIQSGLVKVLQRLRD